MHIKIYGKAKGYPLLVFPTQDGTAEDYEQFGMIKTIAPYIENNIFEVFTVDSIDKESFSDEKGDKEKRIQIQENYYRFVTEEVVPFIHKRNHSTRRILLTGNSMGGYHSANFLFRRPDFFEGCICLSGVYDATYFFNGWINPLVYDNSPVHYLENMPLEHPYVSIYRKRTIILCVGQGRWEEEGLSSQPKIAADLKLRDIPAFVDYWGKDVDHDWCWWKKMIVYLLPKAIENLEEHGVKISKLPDSLS